jgi:hypothetical protein
MVAVQAGSPARSGVTSDTRSPVVPHPTHVPLGRRPRTWPTFRCSSRVAMSGGDAGLSGALDIRSGPCSPGHCQCLGSRAASAHRSAGCRSAVRRFTDGRVPELSRLRGLWENQHPIQSASSHLPKAGIGRDGMRMDGAERRRREFIRVNHPDRGGDPDVFIAGMRSFGAEAGSLGTEPLPRVVVVNHRSWLTRLAIAVAQRLRHGNRAPRVR